jgi:hypothetical protein
MGTGWGTEVSAGAQSIPSNQPYAKPKKMSTRQILQAKLFCRNCHETFSPVEYCAATKVVLLQCGCHRSL